MNEPTHLDLFSGIGGFALAAKWSGFRTVGFSEIDPYASAVLWKHWPDVPNLGDIRTADMRQIGHVDILTAGVPCQPASRAGLQRGTKDNRWLWPEALRVLRECCPEFAVFENPDGILDLEGGLVFEHLLTQLEDEDYDVQPYLIPSCAVGAWQERKRLFLVAHRHGANQYRGIESFQVGRKRGEASLVEAGFKAGGVRATEPGVGRMVYGVPNRMDRLKGLGNAVDPQVAAVILQSIRKLLP